MSWVYRDLGFVLLIVFDFYCHQQQLKFYKTDPEIDFRVQKTGQTKTYSAASRKLIPLKLEERVSMYISHPVPCAMGSTLFLPFLMFRRFFFLWSFLFAHLQVVVLPDRHVRSLWEKFHSKQPTQLILPSLFPHGLKW